MGITIFRINVIMTFREFLFNEEEEQEKGEEQGQLEGRICRDADKQETQHGDVGVSSDEMTRR